MATSAQYAAVPKIGVGQVSTANTNRDGTGTIATIFTAGTNGSRIEFVDIVATQTTTAGVVRLFIHDGTNARLIEEILVTAVTPGTSTAVWSATWFPPGPFVLPTSYSLRASTQNAEAFNVVAVGGDL